MSRLTLLAASIVVGLALAFGASFATASVVSTHGNPVHRAQWQYGTP